MVGEDKVVMSVKELRRLSVIHRVMEKEVRQADRCGAAFRFDGPADPPDRQAGSEGGRPRPGASQPREAVEPCDS